MLNFYHSSIYFTSIQKTMQNYKIHEMDFYLMWIFIPCVSLGVYSTWFSFLESHCDWGEGRERE